MNYNLRTAALIAAGIVSAGSVARAEEASKNPVETALTSTTISGYVSTSAFFDLGEDDGGSMSRLPGRSFDGADKLDKINLDVVKLTIEKPLDEGDWSAGYKVDLLFGPDANTLGTSSVLGENNSDFGVKQAYVTLQTPVGNDLIAKVGVFDTIVGYEVFESGNNPNYSRSYAYFIEPTQHTGLLLSYQIAEGISLSGGIANSWNARINAPGAEAGVDRDFGLQTYLGSLALTAPDSWGALKGATLYAGVVHGLGSAEIGDADPRTSLYAGLTIPTPLTGLGVGVAADYRTVETTDTNTDYAAAFAGYLTYQLSEQLKLGVRGEYAQGSNGTWGAPGPDGEELFGVTATIDYGLWANVLTRIEFRWDKDLSDGAGGFGTALSPEENSYVLGLNLLYKF
ncbi:MAG: outer membrane beta-barrel protein [Verrucomicrobiales bacterium]|nr:outer membrane beta-barrel protein [Verrucomicrobiales bacterium]